MKLTATKTVALTGKNGRKFTLTVGKQLTPSQVNNLTPRQLTAYTQEVVSATKRVPYTEQEAIDLAGCYVASGSHITTARAAFLTLNPETKHTVASINAALGQLRALDNNHPNDNKWVAKTTIISAALETQTSYFDPSGELTDAYHLAG